MTKLLITNHLSGGIKPSENYGEEKLLNILAPQKEIKLGARNSSGSWIATNLTPVKNPYEKSVKTFANFDSVNRSDSLENDGGVPCSGQSPKELPGPLQPITSSIRKLPRVTPVAHRLVLVEDQHKAELGIPSASAIFSQRELLPEEKDGAGRCSEQPLKFGPEQLAAVVRKLKIKRTKSSSGSLSPLKSFDNCLDTNGIYSGRNSQEGIARGIISSRHVSETSLPAIVIAPEKRELVGRKVTFIIPSSLPNERWKEIEEYENYCISDHARIWSRNHGKCIKLNTRYKYHCARLYRSGKRKELAVRNLVASHFIKRKGEFEILRHKDGDEMNSSFKNLEIISINTLLCEISSKNSDISDKKEQWRPIKRYNGYYYISDKGNVFSRYIMDHMKLQTDGNGYKYVLLQKGGKKKHSRINRLVARHFIGEIPTKYEVDHVNWQRDQNHLTNLRIVTMSENRKNKSMESSGKRPVIQYDENMNRLREFSSVSDAARILGLNSPHIISCCRGRQKTTGRYKWQYKFFRPDKKKKIFTLRDDEEIKCLGIINGKDLSNYEVTNQGRVKHKDRKVELTPSITSGYKRVSLYYHNKEGKSKSYTVQISRLVAILFCSGRTKELNCANHLNGQKTDDNFRNLEWTTTQGNVEHGIGIPVKLMDTRGNISRHNTRVAARKMAHVGKNTKIKHYLNTGKPYCKYYWYDDSYQIPQTLIDSLKNDDI